MQQAVLAFGLGGISPMEMMIVAGIALLLFGKRLPEVARSMGKGIVEFKKGIAGIEDQVDSSASRRSTSTPSSAQSRPVPEDDQAESRAPKFEPPKFEPSEPKEV